MERYYMLQTRNLHHDDTVASGVPKCVDDVADECISVVLVAWQRVDDVVASVAAVAVVVHMDVVVVVVVVVHMDVVVVVFVVVIVAVAVIVVAVVVAVVVVVVLACDSRE